MKQRLKYISPFTCSPKDLEGLCQSSPACSAATSDDPTATKTHAPAPPDRTLSRLLVHMRLHEQPVADRVGKRDSEMQKFQHSVQLRKKKECFVYAVIHDQTYNVVGAIAWSHG